MADTISLPGASTGDDAHAEWLVEDATIGRCRDGQTYGPYSSYSLGIPVGSTIQGIEVILYGTSNDADGPDHGFL